MFVFNNESYTLISIHPDTNISYYVFYSTNKDGLAFIEKNNKTISVYYSISLINKKTLLDLITKQFINNMSQLNKTIMTLNNSFYPYKWVRRDDTSFNNIFLKLNQENVSISNCSFYNNNSLYNSLLFNVSDYNNYIKWIEKILKINFSVRR